MAKRFSTQQEDFWAGEFGSEYINRNRGDDVLAARTHLLSQSLRNAKKIDTALEFGANIGINILALRHLLPRAKLAAIEINAAAVSELKNIPELVVHHGSILEPQVDQTYDLTLAIGVLIHVNPDALNKVYDNLYASTNRFILIAEYYNPTPIAVPYRGYDDRLFKRDFAGDMLDKWSDITLVDYGFCYRRASNFALDDLTWFLLEKVK